MTRPKSAKCPDGRAAWIPAAAICAVLLTVAGCSSGPTFCSPGAVSASDSGASECTAVLFLGNSYTYVNDLPGTFAKLADSGGHSIDTAMVANGGETLAEHAASAESLDEIASTRWSYVVLQEQSQTPATSAGVAQSLAAARTLGDKARRAGARPLLFITPAHQDGMPEAGLPNYETMQRAIDNGYQSIARSLSDAVAPVGYVWFMVVRQHSAIDLWQDDGSHPSAAGTYLEACVFYDTIFRQPSAGLSFLGGLTSDEARTLQTAADDNVPDYLS